MNYNFSRRQALVLPLQAAVIPSALAASQVPLSQPALNFGPDFIFGISSSAYQIEGAVHEDGRGPGIWDIFTHQSGRISDGRTADVACDHYHKMPADVSLIAAANIKNYRFSVSWPRLFPDGDDKPNPIGFAFYDRLIDELHSHGITPWLCLYHWDLPQALQAKGGWTNRETSLRFAEFANYVSRYFQNRVASWMVLNEAGVQAMFGYGVGWHAPGMSGKASWFSALHHLNLGQGLAIQALRANNVAGKIGTVACCEPVRPSSNEAADIKAAVIFDAVWNKAVLQPLFHGSYPALIEHEFAELCRTNDLADINQKIDLLGVNYYSRLHIQADAASPIGAGFGPIHDTSRFTVMGWPIEPDGIYEILTHLKSAYGDPELFISENGYATTDGSAEAGFNDAGRITYMSDHLNFVHQAIDSGVRVSGYFVWSLLDSFEWNDGMKWHFGLVKVDFSTLIRTPKHSYYWYADLIKRNAGKAIQASSL